MAKWITQFTNEPKLEVIEMLILNFDNKMYIALTKIAKSQRRTKHIYVQHQYIIELIDEGELTVLWISISDILANGITKV